MKAAVITGRRHFEIREMPVPEVRPGSLLIKVRRCAICGTDLEFADHHGWDSGDKEDRFLGSRLDEAILGHEWVGEITEIGDGVEGLTIGDRVVSVKRSCGQCYFCHRGLHYLCRGGPVRQMYGEGASWASMNGAMAEYIIRNKADVMKVPDSVSDEEAALIEPFNVGLSAVYEAGIKDGDSVAIIGGGHIGQLTLLAVKTAGAAPIILTDRVQSRLDKAKELGADYALNIDEGDVYQQMVEITEAGPDFIVICVRDADVIPQCLRAVRLEGTIVLLGFPAPARIDPLYLVIKGLKIIAANPAWRYNPQAMRLMQYKRVDCRNIASAVMPLEDVNMAFDSLYSGENLLVMLRP